MSVQRIGRYSTVTLEPNRFTSIVLPTQWPVNGRPMSDAWVHYRQQNDSLEGTIGTRLRYLRDVEPSQTGGISLDPRPFVTRSVTEYPQAASFVWCDGCQRSFEGNGGAVMLVFKPPPDGDRGLLSVVAVERQSGRPVPVFFLTERLQYCNYAKFTCDSGFFFAVVEAFDSDVVVTVNWEVTIGVDKF